MSAGPLQAIFIGGCIRSGTTMLGEIIGRDPHTICLPESPFLLDLTSGERLADQEAADGLLSWIQARRDFLAWREQGDYATPFVGPDGLSRAEFLDDLIRQYGMHTGRPGARRFVDHTPQNVRDFDRLAGAFPAAKFVNLIRDGRAVAHSVLPLDFGPGDVPTAARVWIDAVSAGLAAQIRLGPDQCMTVRYEDLIARPENLLPRIAQQGGLDPAALAGSEPGFRVPAFNRTIHARVGQAPDPARIDAWRGGLTAKQIRFFEHAAGHLLRILRYEPVNVLPVRGPSHLERLAQELRAYALKHKRRRAETRRIRTSNALVNGKSRR